MGKNADTTQQDNLNKFIQQQKTDKSKYIIFPSRVSGNHWGMFILENNGGDKQVYYTSSLSPETEIEQIKPLITQLVSQNAANNIQIIHGTKQNNGYDCGVYLVKYIEELLETGNLALTRSITEQECQEFRREWKEKISREVGSGEWCKIDVRQEEDIKGEQQQAQILQTNPPSQHP